MLRNPSPDDWLMFSRTYDAQRYSPLKEITKSNVSQLELAWKIDLPTGTTETVPTVYRGVMYTIVPDGTVRALDAATGNQIWQYKRGGNSRSKTLAIYDDMIYYTAPDSFVVALDAKTGELRWETKADSRGHTSGPIIVEAKSSPRHLQRRRETAISDLTQSGKALEVLHLAGPDDPAGDASWGGAPVAVEGSTRAAGVV
jgi:alcohol dehydrogenase (cytochrome c)